MRDLRVGEDVKVRPVLGRFVVCYSSGITSCANSILIVRREVSAISVAVSTIFGNMNFKLLVGVDIISFRRLMSLSVL